MSKQQPPASASLDAEKTLSTARSLLDLLDGLEEMWASEMDDEDADKAEYAKDAAVRSAVCARSIRALLAHVEAQEQRVKELTQERDKLKSDVAFVEVWADPPGLNGEPSTRDRLRAECESLKADVARLQGVRAEARKDIEARQGDYDAGLARGFDNGYAAAEREIVRYE
jgi:hypothetical protein